MQKSKNSTIIIILFIFVYGLLSELILSKNINKINLFILNPMFWIGMALFLKFTLPNTSEKRSIRKELLQYTLIAILIYIIVNLLSGLFITFGNNPYSTTPKGIIINLWCFASIIIAKEYIRYQLINNVYTKDKIIIAILISIVYIIIELGISKYFYANITTLYIIKQLSQILIPLIAKNILYSFAAMNKIYTPSIVYEVGTNLFNWMSPILPNSPWVMNAILETTIPVILFLYIRYIQAKNDIHRNRYEIQDTNPGNIIPFIILTVLAVWFAIGIFPIKPVAIATGSMEKKLMVGDIAVIKKCDVNDIEVGDIIEYQLDGYTVIHRVIEKTQTKGEYTLITKGDNNNAPDAKPVIEDQIIGKLIFKVKYLGYPAIWLHKAQEAEQVEVETGK